jgi:hypothetical protein
MRGFSAIFLAFFAVTAAADVQDGGAESDRYQSIIDRQMFGKPPPGFDPMKMPSEVSKGAQKELTKEQAKLQSAVHFSVINIASDGTPVVGFSDNSDPKMPLHLYLRLGEERAGWLVKAADPQTATMTVVKGDIELTMKLGDKSAQSGAGGAPASAHAPAPAIEPQRKLGGGTLLSRRALRQRREREAQQQDEQRRAEEKAEREAAQAAMREEIRALREDLKSKREAANAAAENKSEEEGAANDDAQ